MDAGTGEIVVVALTTNDADDASQVGPLLDPLASFIGDGAYDEDSLYRSVIDRDPEALVIVPPHTTAICNALPLMAGSACRRRRATPHVAGWTPPSAEINK